MCQEKAGEWEARQKSRAEELKVIDEAAVQKIHSMLSVCFS